MVGDGLDAPAARPKLSGGGVVKLPLAHQYALPKRGRSGRGWPFFTAMMPVRIAAVTKQAARSAAKRITPSLLHAGADRRCRGGASDERARSGAQPR